MNFYSGVSRTGNRFYFPFYALWTTPSRLGDFLASAYM